MAVEVINDRKAYDWIRTLNPNIEAYTIQRLVDVQGILETIDNSVGRIMESKGVTKDGVNIFVQEIQKNIKFEDLPHMINLVAAPPFNILSYLNRVVNIQEICHEANFENYKWLTTHKFPGGANVGSFEAFLITLFDKMSNPAKGGDVMFNNKDIIEVKGSGGRLRGQNGINNVTNYIEELMLKMKYKLPSNYLHFNINKDTISSLQEKIDLKLDELALEERKYKEKLEGKKKRMDACKNKATKKYKTAKDSYDKYNISTPRSIEILNEDIENLERDQDHCILENISIDLAKDSIDNSVDFFVKIFSRKYNRSDVNEIEKFVKKSLYPDGSFSDIFLLEYFIFEFEYYQFLEEFKYFCLVNLKDDTMLIIDSAEKFREFVYEEIITIKSYPSFSDYAGQQGMVFAVELKG